MRGGGLPMAVDQGLRHRYRRAGRKKTDCLEWQSVPPRGQTWTSGPDRRAMDGSGAAVIKAIVTDIEGTTSSIDFVHHTLFPYASQHLRRFLRDQAGDASVPQIMADVDAHVGHDLSIKAPADVLEPLHAEARQATTPKP